MKTRIIGVVALLIGLSICSFAGTITSGVFDISGTIYVTTAEATAVVTPAGTCAAGDQCIFWQDSNAANDEKVDISSAGLPNGDIPANISGNDAATIANLSNPPDAVGSTISVADFMTFLNGGITTDLTLTFIEPGFYSNTDCTLAPAVGQTCTLTGSLFNFVNNPPPIGQATATWVLEGTTTSGSAWTGNFTSQFPANTPFQTVFSELAANGYVSNTFSATFSLTPPTMSPEPGTAAMMVIGGGLVGLASLLRRRRSTK